MLGGVHRSSNCSPYSDRKSTRLNSSHLVISYAVFCLVHKTGSRTCDNYHADRRLLEDGWELSLAFFFNDPAPPEIYTLSLHDALPICLALGLTTSVRLPPSVYAWWTALAAVIVDFPHCREQFRIPRLLSVPNTRAWSASAPSPRSEERRVGK